MPDAHIVQCLQVQHLQQWAIILVNIKEQPGSEGKSIRAFINAVSLVVFESMLPYCQSIQHLSLVIYHHFVSFARSLVDAEKANMLADVEKNTNLVGKFPNGGGWFYTDGHE